MCKSCCYSPQYCCCSLVLIVYMCCVTFSFSRVRSRRCSLPHAFYCANDIHPRCLSYQQLLLLCYCCLLPVPIFSPFLCSPLKFHFFFCVVLLLLMESPFRRCGISSECVSHFAPHRQTVCLYRNVKREYECRYCVRSLHSVLDPFRSHLFIPFTSIGSTQKIQ